MKNIIVRGDSFVRDTIWVFICSSRWDSKKTHHLANAWWCTLPLKMFCTELLQIHKSWYILVTMKREEKQMKDRRKILGT